MTNQIPPQGRRRQCEKCKKALACVMCIRVVTCTRWHLCQQCFSTFVGEDELSNVVFYPPGRPPAIVRPPQQQ